MQQHWRRCQWVEAAVLLPAAAGGCRVSRHQHGCLAALVSCCCCSGCLGGCQAPSVRCVALTLLQMMIGSTGKDKGSKHGRSKDTVRMQSTECSSGRMGGRQAPCIWGVVLTLLQRIREQAKAASMGAVTLQSTGCSSASLSGCQTPHAWCVALTLVQSNAWHGCVVKFC